MRSPKKEQERDPFVAKGRSVLLLLIMGILAAFSVVSIKLGRVAERKMSQRGIHEEKRMMEGFKERMRDRRDRLKQNRTALSRPLARQEVMFPKWDGGMPTSLGAQEPQILPTFQSPDGGAFVHMGKTGGSTLSILLRNGCHSWMPHPCRNVTDETIASELIDSYYHVPDFAFLRQSHHDFYLITIRDPFDRAVSAFVYEHMLNRIARKDLGAIKKNKLKALEEAYTCFPTLEKFASFLSGNSSDFSYPYRKNEIEPRPCKDFARAAFHGHVRPFNHLYFSFERIKSFIPSPEEQTIFVTRQEYLWDDWKSVNTWLGHDREVVLPAKAEQAQVRNTTHMKLPVTRDVSPEGVQALCAALQDEYDVFFWFVRKAKNLSPDDVQRSIDKAKTKCPDLRVYPWSLERVER